MNLALLFEALIPVFSGSRPIERFAREQLLSAEGADLEPGKPDLPAEILDVIALESAHPVCRLISEMSFDWAPPTSSPDPLYVQHSLAKVHVELLGPGGLVHSDDIRLGIYGMRPHAEYGIRTHPAEEIYIMLAGQADWMRGDEPYTPLLAGERSYHPSMLPHASRTGPQGFLSVYAWRGDVSTDNYVYAGLPNEIAP